MPTRFHFAALLAVTAVVWFVASLLRGVPVSWGHAAPFASALGVLVGLAGLFNHFGWKWKWLHGWFVKKPNLIGTWVVELQSDWKSPETGEGVDPIRCFYAIEQTFSSLKMHLMTPESQSWLLAHVIRESVKSNGYQVFAVYTNEPKSELRGDRSEIHYGSFAFDFHGPDHKPNSFTGEYWTDRNTRGSMTGRKMDEVIFTTYVDALDAVEAENGTSDDLK